MRSKKRVVAAASLALVTVFVTFALAQPRGRPHVNGAPPRPKPTATATATSADPYAAPAASSAVSAPPAPTPSATAAPTEAPPRPEPAGSGKLSPLNPQPNEFPARDAGPPPQTLDYDRLLADIAALRARVAAVSDTLFHSRIAVSMETSGDHGKIGRLTVSLDDGVVFTAPANFRADDATAIYDHAVAPGRHAVTVEVERRDDREEAFRTVQRSRFVVEVPRDHRLDLAVRVWDDSTMAEFPGDKSGRYDLRIRAKASAKPIGR